MTDGRIWDAEPGRVWSDEIYAQEVRNKDYYRSLVVQIGELFGVEARTADDGGVHEDVLCSKVPEIVRTALAERDTLRREISKVLEGFDKGFFVRDVCHDHEPDWAIKLLPYLTALGKLAATEERP